MSDDRERPAGDGRDEARGDASSDGENEDAPLDDLARRVGERRAATAREGNPAGDADGDPDVPLDRRGPEDVDDPAVPESFEWTDVDTVDVERVWAALDDDDDTLPGGTPLPQVPPTERGDAPDPVGTEHVVPKADYCERCRFFAAPPTVACEHEGTEIVSVPDRDHFRLRNCPVVAADDEDDLGPVADRTADGG